MKNKLELLAPAGNFTMLVSAINAGADAVYFGLQNFSMRNGKRNFKISDLEKINKICAEKKVKKYLTLNTIVYDNELKKLKETIKKVRGKVDAIICWDLSVINLCNKYKIPFFVSTQASISNIETAKFYKKLGAKRVILARELNLKQIKEISKIINVECFAHGAMCVAISGRCFTSQFLFGKSANRGECLHPCRRSYSVKDEEKNELKIKNNKIFSAKDLCTLPFISKMKKAGIISFKIEGRNRDPRYVDAVVRVYRKALDKNLTKKEIEDGLKKLEEVYNKGFSSGFYLKIPTADDFSKIEHNASKKKKSFVGKVEHYYDQLGVALVRLVSKLKVGEEIVIIGKTTGIVKWKVESLEMKKKQIIEAKKGDEVGIKIPKKVRKNDEIYVVRGR